MYLLARYVAPMGSHALHSGVATTMMGTVVNSRMEMIGAIVKRPTLEFKALHTIVQYTRNDLGMYIKMNKVFAQDTQGALPLFREIYLFLTLFERCAKICDKETALWCYNEINRLLFKACISF